MAGAKLLCVLMAMAVAEGSNCPSSFEEIGSICYYFSSDFGVKETWNGAVDHCQNLGYLFGVTANLAEVGTDSTCSNDYTFMEAVATKSGEQIFLGASDSGHEGQWVWQHSGADLPLSSNQWWSDEPGEGTTENCLLAWTGFSGDVFNRVYFGDGGCTVPRYFICQIY
ncbi:unnamed protein product [Meganyctiphanes norvegica]|uniref:C-type lectin domain-containing protein n=1 Tax=Meganyctiphanes norvegica TaxID=48144 RepID=A0AAV2SEG2_MEGNR